MDPALKSKLLKLLVGALIASAVAGAAYFSAHLPDLFSALPFGLVVGFSAAILAGKL